MIQVSSARLDVHYLRHYVSLILLYLHRENDVDISFQSLPLLARQGHPLLHRLTGKEVIRELIIGPSNTIIQSKITLSTNSKVEGRKTSALLNSVYLVEDFNIQTVYSSREIAT